MKSTKGFTLVELSIVILVTGILYIVFISIGGLLRTSKIQKTIIELDDYSQKVLLFYNQYLSYPGDFGEASIQFQGCDSDCNGNNDGYIDDNYNSEKKNEALRAWQHLFLSKISSLKLSGVGLAPVIAVNVPGSIYMPYMMWGFATITLPTQKYSVLRLSAVNNNSSILCEDIRNIDQKIDDGLPRRGSIIASLHSNNCYSNNLYHDNFINNESGDLEVIIVNGINHPNYESINE